MTLHVCKDSNRIRHEKTAVVDATDVFKPPVRVNLSRYGIKKKEKLDGSLCIIYKKVCGCRGESEVREGARSGIGARRRDFRIIRDNPWCKISVKKKQHMVSDKMSVKASRRATSQPRFRLGELKSAVSFIQVCSKSEVFDPPDS